jgi:diguanylate cyclase (GGDEF)-like protein/PAS domain S-box-containing protein
MDLHPLLQRQLKRLGIAADGELPVEVRRWGELLGRVSRAYDEHDQERYLLERSQDLASSEMTQLYATLRDERDALDGRVRERTEALRLSEARLASLLSLSADWIWEQDEELRFTYLSDGIEAAAGIMPEQVIGKRREFGSTYDADPAQLAAFEACLAERRPFRDFVFSLMRPDGVKRWVRISGEPVFDSGGVFRGYRGVGRDVTQAALAEQRMQELARFDGLTGLPNRNMFLGELEHTVARARRRGEAFAVCFIDLDRFKTINDTLGHAAGDQLLQAMAGRLRGALRESDLVARLGGDEFVVVAEGPNGAAELARMANKLLHTIGAPLVLAGRDCLVTGSIGIARFPGDGADALTLLRHADAAMYLAKERGKNNVQFYTAELAAEADRQFALESELRHALEHDELTLHYQPRVHIDGGAMRSVEALLRWRHPVRGLVLPGEFVPLAEERGLIVPIGRWVLQAVCRQLHAWHAMGLDPVPVALNLSARQFASDSLVDDLLDAMRQQGVAPHEIEVEITESALMAEPERAKEALQRMGARGVRIAIDDFGTGYSSLSYLKRFPAHAVKIDRSFVSGLPADREDVAITQAVIAMAHSLGLVVVGEGVETAEQLQMLRSLGCDEAQGFLLGRPMPADELALQLGRTAIALPLSSAA